MDALFLVGRILIGGYFLMSGINHFAKTGMLTGYARSRGVPSPKVATIVSGVFIFLGGLGILFGAYIVWSVILIVVFLLVVSFQVHHFWSDTDPQQKMSEMVNFMKNMALVGALLMLLAIPEPWALSVF